MNEKITKNYSSAELFVIKHSTTPMTPKEIDEYTYYIFNSRHIGRGDDGEFFYTKLNKKTPKIMNKNPDKTIKKEVALSVRKHREITRLKTRQREIKKLLENSLRDELASI